ncbi:MAG: molecular chaperone HtpG, partial [Anaeroplasmataceae bacterium]
MAKNIKFKTETKRLLDLMINSIYTNKEIFLRELISNSSDALDKHHFLSLTNDKIKSLGYEIVVECNKENRTITITDTGIGFTYEQLNDHLGTIAKSGSKEFIEKIESSKDKDKVDIIGQFGVGFYSAFMVAEEVEVKTKSPLSDKGYIFKSEGLESYSIDELDKTVDGTEIVIHLKANDDNYDYDSFLDEYKIKELIKKYSDYVRYPIKTWVSKYIPAEKEGEEGSTSLSLEVINSMIPLWKKSKSEVTEEELNTFYKQKFMDFQDPLTSLFVNVEGMITYNALVFIPRKSPFAMDDRNERGLQLYTKGVFILEKCKELIPEYLRFVKGLVDCSDLSLNIIREMLQEDRMLTKISTNIEKKILSELSKLLANDKAKYEEFYKEYGLNLKFGGYEQNGAKKDL